MITDLLILVVETLTIREALKHTIQENYSVIVIASDSLIAIHAINGNSIPPIFICNLVEDIKILTQKIDIISSAYCGRFANKITDMIVKEVSHSCTSNFCYK